MCGCAAGDTVGFTPDVEVALGELSRAVHALGLAHGQRYDHIQVHISFPFDFRSDKDAAIRRSVLALLVHVSDYLFLHCFDQLVTDKLNELWSCADCTALFAAANGSAAQFSEFVVKSDSIPNDALKLKAVGLRGVDVYKRANRYGMELRKGFTLLELDHIVRLVSRVLCDIGMNEAEHCLLRLCDDSRDEDGRYSVKAMADWVTGPHRRVAHVQDKSNHGAHSAAGARAGAGVPVAATAADAVSALDTEKVDAAVEPWLDKMMQDETHLAACKKVAFGRPPGEGKVSDGFVSRAVQQLRQRVSFLLSTDWTHFPSSGNVALLAMMADEQLYLVSLLEQQIPVSNVRAARAAVQAHGPASDRADVASAKALLARQAHAGACFREAAVEFAARLAALY